MPQAPEHARDYSAIAEQYAKDIVSGKIVAGKLMKLACKRHLDDLGKLTFGDWPYYFDRWHGDDICDFIEKLPHVEGTWVTPTLFLEPPQVFMLVCIFGWRKEDGNRRFTTVHIEVARKAAKSTITAGVALYCLCCEGEVGPQIIIGATTGEQAGKVFNPARHMVDKTPELREAFELEAFARAVTCRMNNGSIQPINAKGKTQDGWNPHVGILDELHAHKDRTLYDVIKSAFGARKNPLFWIITTAGFDTNGVCYEHRSTAVKMLEGAVRLDHLFAAIFTLDAEAHDDTLEFPYALLEFESSCAPALITLIERSWVEVCAKHAITLGTMPETEALAQIILTSPLTAWGFVENATQKNSTLDTQTSKSESESRNRSGSTLTESALTPSPQNGASRKAPRGVYVIDSRPNTASRWSVTRSSSSSSTGNAASAVTLRKLCAWIIITARDAFGDSFASNATLRSAFSETLARVWRELSRTCDQEMYSISGTVLTAKRPPDDPFDEKNWIKANPMLGITPSLAKMRSDSADAQVSPREEGNFKTKNLNIWMNAASAWLNVSQWNLCADPNLDWSDFEGLDCYIGGDLADKDDITALVLAAFDKKGRLIFKPRFWLPEAVLMSPDHAEGRGPAPYRTWSKGDYAPLTLTSGDWVDQDEVEKVARGWIKRFNVKKVTFDQFGAAQTMASRINNDLADPDRPLAQILHKSAKNVTDAAKELEARVKAGPIRMRHDGNPVMTWMASNCTVSRRRDETLLPVKETQMSPNKIDGIDALINAIHPAILVPERQEKPAFQMIFV